MNYKLIYSLTALCMLRNRVMGLSLIANIFKGFSNEIDDNMKKVPSDKMPIIHDPDTIDLSFYGRALYGEPDFNYTGKLVAMLEQNETASVNPEELGSYLEGDILVPKTTLIHKNGLRSKAYRWRNGEVPYEIDDDFETNELNMIAFAMDEYHAKTCIRFKPRTWEWDYISFKRGNSGCWSSIGRMGGKQSLNLQAPGCLRKLGTTIHELMHVLGFIHEQNREERDSYVDIQMQNVENYALSNFRKESNTVSFGVGYDYGSVMHYSAIAFSKNGQPTIVSKKPIISKTIMGQREGFSKMDVDKVNRMYNCEVNIKPPEPPVKLQKRAPPHFFFPQGFAYNNFGSFFGNLFNKVNGLGDSAEDVIDSKVK